MTSSISSELYTHSIMLQGAKHSFTSLVRTPRKENPYRTSFKSPRSPTSSTSTNLPMSQSLCGKLAEKGFP